MVVAINVFNWVPIYAIDIRSRVPAQFEIVYGTENLSTGDVFFRNMIDAMNAA